MTSLAKSVVVWLACVAVVAAQEEPLRLDRVRVSPEQLKSLLKTGNLVPIRRDELQQRLARALGSQRPRYTATTGRVRYHARLTQPTRLSGSFQATIVTDVSAGPVLVSLGRPRFHTLQIEGLKWGNDAHGNAVARVDRTANNAIQGTWTCQGSRRNWGAEFVFGGLDALASELVLDLPESAGVLSDGTVLPADENSEVPDGLRRWRIIPLDNAATQLTILNSRETPSATPHVESRITWSVRRDTMSFRAEYLVQSGQPLRSLSVPLPPNSTVESVAYGDNTKLPIELTTVRGERVVRVRLPEALVGASRSLVIGGRSQGILNEEWLVPSLQITECTTSAGEAVIPTVRDAIERVRINAPLELQQINLSGVRQTDSVFDSDGSHTISLARLTKDARASLRLGQAERGQRYQLVSRVAQEFGVWATQTLLLSELPLPDEVRLRMPVGLTVLSVSAGTDRTPCEFSLGAPADGFVPVRITLPPTENTFLDIRGYADRVDSVPLYRTSEQLYSSVAVVPAGSISLIGSNATQISPTQLQNLLPESVSVTAFAGPGTTVIQLDPLRPLPLETGQPDGPAPSVSDVSPPRTPDRRTTVQMDLVSSLGSAPDVDTHTARMTVTASDMFSFQLGETAFLVEVRVNGTTTRFERIGDVVRVPLEPGARTNVIEARYRHRAPTSGLLTRQHAIPAPTFRSDADVRWTIQLAEGVQLVEASPFGPRGATQPGRLRCLLGPFAGNARGPEEYGPTLLPYCPAELKVTTTQSSQVPGYAWIALMLSVLPALAILRARGGVLLCAIIGALALACFVTPLPVAQVCGGCLIGCIIPFGVGDLIRKPDRAARPSVSKSVSVAATAVLLLSLCWTAKAVGQSSGDKFRVFELADDNTVYVRSELLEFLDAAAEETTPAYLLQSGRYHVDPQGGGVSIAARIEVLLTRREDVLVSFPFARANCGSCRVDGVETAFRIVGEQIVIPIHASGASFEAQTAAADPTRAVVIEVELHPPFDQNMWHVPLPPTSSTSATVAGDGSQILVNGQTLTGEPATINGPLLVRRLDDASPTEPVETAQFQNECTVEVGPNEVTVAHRLTVTPGTVPLRNLSLRFPSTQRFTSLETAAACRQRVVRTADESYIAVEFEEAITEPLQLRIGLACGIAEPLAECRLHLRPLLPDASMTEVTSVTSRPGLEIRAVTIEDPAANTSVAHEQPAPIRIDRPVTLRVEVAALEAARDVWLNQAVRIRADRLDYTLRAELQVTHGPVFEHALTVDPRLQIETVAVRENQVDRLARYQRRGNELLLLLDGRTSGVQEVLIEGYVPRQLDEQSELPTVVVRNATVKESTLVLNRDAELEAVLRNKDGVPFAVSPDGAITDGLATTGEATFRLLETTQLPLIQTRLRRPALVDSICHVNPIAAGSGRGLDVSWVLRITNPAGGPLKLDPNGGTIVTNHNCEITDLADAAVEVAPAGGPAIIVVRFDDAPDAEEVPTVTWLSTIEENQRLLALPADGSLEVSGTDPSNLDVPDWASEHLADDVRLFESVAPWVVSRAGRDNGSAAAPGDAATFVETRVWLRDERCSGVTTLVTDTSARQIRINVPTGVQVRAVEHGKQPIPIPHVTPSGLMTIRMLRGGEVKVRWKASTADDLLRLPFPVRRTGDAFFVVHASAEERLESARTTLVNEEDFITRRSEAGASPAQATAEPTTVLALDVNDSATESPVFAVTRMDTAGTNLGLGMLAAFLAGVGCLGLQTLRAGGRTSILLVVAGVLLISHGHMVSGVLSSLTAPLAFRLLPRSS